MYAINFPIRIMMAMFMAFLVTITLFAIMNLLIEMNEFGELDTSHTTIVELVKPPKPDPLITKIRKPAEKPPKVETPPPVIPSLFPTGKVISTYVPPTEFVKPRPGPAARGFTDGSFLPIVKVQPIYPRRAISQGIEGYVIVEFDVYADGSVHNPRVVEHHPNEIFDTSAIKAVLKFKYKPQISNGIPEIVTGVRNKLTFELAEG